MFAGGNRRPGGEGEGHAGEGYAFQVDRVRAAVDDLDELEGGVRALRDGRVVVDLVDDQRRRGRQRREVLRAGRAARLAAGVPVGRVAVVERRFQQGQGRATTVGRGRPGRGRAIGEGQHGHAEAVAEGQRLAAAAQAAGTPLVDIAAGGGVAGGVVGHDDRLAGGDGRAGGEGGGDAGRGVAAQVEGPVAGVGQFEELPLIVAARLQRRVDAVVDFADDQRQGGPVGRAGRAAGEVAGGPVGGQAVV